MITLPRLALVLLAVMAPTVRAQTPDAEPPAEAAAPAVETGVSGRVIQPPGTALGLPFSPGIRTDELIYLSGAIGNEPGVAAVTGNDATQTRKTLENLESVLAEIGLPPSRIVSTTVYISDAARYAQIGPVLRAYAQDAAGDVPPTRSVVEADIAIPDAVLEMSAIAAAEGVEVRAITPPGWPLPTNGYRWGVLAGDSLFISGQGGIDPTTGRGVKDTLGQVRTALENIDAVVRAADLERGDLVGCRVYLSDPRDFPALNEAWRAFFADVTPPTRATIRARSLSPAIRVQIQCQAARGAARRKVVAASEAGGSPPFSPAIEVGERLYLSGFVGRGPDGYPAGVAAQTGVVLDRLAATLEAAGLDFEDVVDATVYLSDVRFYAAMNEVYGARMPAAAPARATVGSQLMSPDALVEIVMTAERSALPEDEPAGR